MEYRLPKIENPARQHGLTINRVADRRADISELQQTTFVMSCARKPTAATFSLNWTE
jgi:hypothetical protein